MQILTGLTHIINCATHTLQNSCDLGMLTTVRQFGRDPPWVTNSHIQTSQAAGIHHLPHQRGVTHLTSAQEWMRSMMGPWYVFCEGRCLRKQEQEVAGNAKRSIETEDTQIQRSIDRTVLRLWVRCRVNKVWDILSHMCLQDFCECLEIKRTVLKTSMSIITVVTHNLQYCAFLVITWDWK